MSSPPPSTDANASPRLLVVDDEPDLRTLYELSLVREGYEVECAGTVEEAWPLLTAGRFDLVITDMRLPDGTGLDLLRRMEEAGRPEKGIVITAYGSAENAVEALKAGAYDYLTKPVDLRQFRAVVASALGRLPAEAAGARAGGSPAAQGATPPGRERRREPRVTTQVTQALQRMVGGSPTMQAVRAMVARVARSMAPVLVNGESGTGKELVARAIHEVSPRSGGPFVAVNCGAIPENLLEAEFFGWRKGAFTGASDEREGLFQAAQGGTLFLDEIGDLPLAMQSKLLRVIQERVVRPLGGVTEVPVNVRLVSATHRDLAAAVRAGQFRQDLFYRLNVIAITVPPLRERVADLPQICAAVLDRLAAEAGISPPPTLTPAASQRLLHWDYPGNVRELENLLQRAVALAAGPQIDEADLGLPVGGGGSSEEVRPGHAGFADPAPSAVGAPPPAPPASAAVAGGVAVSENAAGSGAGADAGAATPDASVVAGLPALPQGLPDDLVAHLDAVERSILERALERHRYNRTAAGASLGLSLRQMRYRMARLGVGGERADSDGAG
jgi:two-component system, NtrC family, response regulator PilR